MAKESRAIIGLGLKRLLEAVFGEAVDCFLTVMFDVNRENSGRTAVAF